MIFVGVLIGIILIGGMSFLALDKKSNFHTRLASLGALALMILTVIICVFIILTDNRVPVDPSTLIVGAPVEIKDESDNNVIALLFTIIFFLALFVVIAVLAMKEHKKHKPNSDVITSVW
ncbi:MAG: hypothetical protein FWD22_00040 [Treponema sp.]|nr:hypothetical protein [Treponema sp.]